MTVQTTITKNRVLGNGLTTIFNYSFNVTDADHIKVILGDENNDETTLIKDTNYTVDSIGGSGGQVTLLDLTAICGAAVLPSGWSGTIYREVPKTQLVDLANQGGFYLETHETKFDDLTMLIQQQQEEIDRCPKVNMASGETGEYYLEQVEAAVSEAVSSGASASASASAANASAVAAAESEENAATSETNANYFMNGAEASEVSCTLSKNTSTTKAAEALASAAAALISENNAAISELNALGSETAAGLSAADAELNGNAAVDAAAAAAISEVNSLTSEQNAAASASEAAAASALCGGRLIHNVSADYTITSQYNTFFLDASSESINITLPNPADNIGVSLSFIVVDITNSIMLTPSSGNILGEASYSLKMKNESIILITNGVNWYAI